MKHRKLIARIEYIRKILWNKWKSSHLSGQKYLFVRICIQNIACDELFFVV
jgi:hypothetical protein